MSKEELRLEKIASVCDDWCNWGNCPSISRTNDGRIVIQAYKMKEFREKLPATEDVLYMSEVEFRTLVKQFFEKD